MTTGNVVALFALRPSRNSEMLDSLTRFLSPDDAMPVTRPSRMASA